MKLTVILPYEKKPEHLNLLELLIHENDRAAEPLELCVICGYKLELASDKCRFKRIELDEKPPFTSSLKASFGGKKGFRYDYISAVKRELADINSDELLIFDCIELAEPIGKAAKKNPILLMRSDFFDEEHPCARMAYHIIKKVIVPSGELIKAGEREYLPTSRCVVLHDAVDPTVFVRDRADASAVRAEIRAKFGIPEDERVYVMTCTPDVASGAVELAKAIESSSHPSARLIICGEPDEEYKNQLVNAASEKTLIFAGELGSTELADVLTASDIMAIPVLNCGGTLSAAQAIALDMPMLVSNSATLAEYVGKSTSFAQARRGLGYVNALEEAIDELDAKLAEDSVNTCEASNSQAWYSELCKIIFGE